MPSSTYIHIPFCIKKCNYCSFVSYPSLDKVKPYMYSLLKEISDNYNNEFQKTIYFGGGTPSLVPLEFIKKVLGKFVIDSCTEITIELNPDDVTEDLLLGLKHFGVNRLSIGSQSFNDKILQIIGRRHNAETTIKAVKMAKNIGFENISLDLMYGLPTQSIDDLNSDLDKIISLDVQHVSTYGLKIEPNTVFGQALPKNLPDDDIQADMYEFINKYLSNCDFSRYEISNFAKKGFESKHNLCYWDNSEYYGFGIGAHGYVDGIRYSNCDNFEKYFLNPAVHENAHLVTQKEKLEEEIFLGLRKTEGLDIEKINELYNIDFEVMYASILDKYKNYFEKTKKGYSFNIQGILISNLILSEFI